MDGCGVKDNSLQDRVTLCINTFERPQCLQKLYKSIKKFYPKIKIIVADDSRKTNPIMDDNIKYLCLPYYVGSSASRNAAMEEVKTEFFVTLDDDFIFSNQTKLERWLDVLDNSNIDLVSGKVDIRNYEGRIIFKDKICKFVKGSVGQEAGLDLYDIVLQFWMGRTQKLRDLGGWDQGQKTKDHPPFFMRHLGKLKIAYHPKVFCHHFRAMPKNYVNFRHGAGEQRYLKRLLNVFDIDQLWEFGVLTARR